MKRNNKAIALPLFALMLTVSLGLGAMVIDVAQGYALKSRIQNAVDASVLAGASQLKNGSSVSSVKDLTLNYLNDNLTMTIPSFQALALDSPGLVIEVGVYDSSSMTFVQNESLSVANALRASFTYSAQTFLAPIFMINNIQISDDAIVVRQIAGYAPPGTSFPLAINSSTLTDALSNSNMIDLYQSGAGENSYWTVFTDSNPSNTDVKNTIDYFQYGTGVKPPAVSVSDDFVINNGVMGAAYNELEGSILANMTFVFAVVTPGMASGTVVADGFVGGIINTIVNGMSDQHISITIDPNYIDNTYGGLGVGNGPQNIGSSEQSLLANSYGIVQ